jgi:hypothetical protein
MYRRACLIGHHCLRDFVLRQQTKMLAPQLLADIPSMLCMLKIGTPVTAALSLPDLPSTLAVLVQKDGDWAAGQSVTYQLPWVAAPLPVEPTEEERARKAEQRERNRERLKEMAAAKKAARVSMPEQCALTMVSKEALLLETSVESDALFLVEILLELRHPLVTGRPARWTAFSHPCIGNQVPLTSYRSGSSPPDQHVGG